MRQFFSNKRVAAQTGILSAATVLLFAAAAVAGNGGNAAFGGLAQQMIGWAQGSLGIVIAIAAMLVGLSIGVVKQSMMAVVTGIGIAIALYYGPTVVTGLLSSVGSLHVVAPAALSIPLF